MALTSPIYRQTEVLARPKLANFCEKNTEEIASDVENILDLGLKLSEYERCFFPGVQYNTIETPKTDIGYYSKWWQPKKRGKIIEVYFTSILEGLKDEITVGDKKIGGIRVQIIPHEVKRRLHTGEETTEIHNQKEIIFECNGKSFSCTQEMFLSFFKSNFGSDKFVTTIDFSK